MPRVFAPSVQTAGPLGKKKKGGGRRRRKADKERSQSLPPPIAASFGKPPEEPTEEEEKRRSSRKSQFIGQELLEWNQENVSSASTSKKKDAVVNATKRTETKASSTAPKSKAFTSSSEKVKASKMIAESRSQKRSAAYDEHDLARARQDYLSLTRHALALDTRCLEDEQRGNETNVCSDFKDFVRTLVVRGASPNLLAVTAFDPNKKMSSKPTGKTTASASTKNMAAILCGITIQIHSLADNATMHKVFESDIVAPVSVPATKTGKTPDSDAISIPQAMTAAHSWSILGEMSRFPCFLLFMYLFSTHLISRSNSTVDSTITEDNKLGPLTKRSPLDITILVTDVSLFCDSDVESHTGAVDRFANYVAPFFHKSRLNSIQIVVASTGTIALQVEHDDAVIQEADADGDVQMKNGEKDVSNQYARNHEHAVTACVEAIQAKLEEHEYVAHSRQGVSIGEEGGNPFNVSFSIIDNSPVGYRQLSRQWIRDSLLVCRLSSRLRFDLPQTLEGLQCTVSLDANYQIFPFAINTPQAKMLLSDLDQMAGLDFNVKQLVPVSSIDASLLYGIPMQVRAGLENDFAQFQEMQALVRSLFHLLQERELAILLNASATGKASKNGLFQSSGSEHLFVLMAQELPASLALTESPQTGLLYRIANTDELLAEATAAGSVASKKAEETESQYVDYIDQAISCLQVRPFNPLDATFLKSMDLVSSAHLVTTNTIDSTCMKEMKIDEHSVETSPRWDDTSGIESRQFDSFHFAPNTCEDIELQGQDEIMELEADGPSQQSLWDDSVGVGALGPLPSQEDGPEDDGHNSGISVFDDEL